jgi:hypothetical protein
LIWPAQALAAQGHDVTIMSPNDRRFDLVIDRGADEPVAVRMPPCDVFVTHRLSHRYMATAVRLMRRNNIAVVVDMDDNLDAVAAGNAARPLYHPPTALGIEGYHSAANVRQACLDATMVTTSTPALLNHYTRPGQPGVVLPNYLPPAWFELGPRVDHADVWWPATIDTHPDDPGVVGHAVASLLRAHPHVRFASVVVPGHNDERCRLAYGLPHPVTPVPPSTPAGWPALVAQAGIGIAPLAKGAFNAGKSALKILEMMAAGVPWVASPSAEYRRLQAQTKVGFLASTPEQWLARLDALVRSPQLRADQSGLGVEAAAGYRLEDHAWRWWRAWTQAWQIQTRASVKVGARR